MYNNINLNLLKYFYEVINTGNITKAAENLFLTQPALTRNMKELENELNTTLIERSKKGVTPTKEGLVLYEHTKKIFNDLDSTIKTIEKTSNEKNLYIGATTTNFLELIVEPLKEFKKNNPDVHINIVLESINVLEEMAKLSKLDIVIKNDYENIDSFKLVKSFKITDTFVASKKYYSELENKTFSLEELINNYPFVLLSSITHGRKNFDEYLKSLNIDYKPTYEFNSYSLCRKLIEEGFGIGIGNPIHYQDKNFIIIKTNFKLPTRIFDIGYLNSSKNELINEFIKLFKKSN